MSINEVSPPGWTGTVRAMKTHKDAKKDIDNPWALAWHMKNKGDKPHYKDQPSSKKGKPKKKKKYKDKKKNEGFDNWLSCRDSKLHSEVTLGGGNDNDMLLIEKKPSKKKKKGMVKH